MDTWALAPSIPQPGAVTGTCTSDPARPTAALVRVHVGSLLTRETAPGAQWTDGTSPIHGSLRSGSRPDPVSGHTSI